MCLLQVLQIGAFSVTGFNKEDETDFPMERDAILADGKIETNFNYSLVYQIRHVKPIAISPVTQIIYLGILKLSWNNRCFIPSINRNEPIDVR